MSEQSACPAMRILESIARTGYSTGQGAVQQPSGRLSMATPNAYALVVAEFLPGENLVIQGLADLAAAKESIEALLVSIGAPRLRRAGISVERPVPDPERRLYDLLSRENPDASHGRYNALIRRLVSFERAAECVRR